MIYTNACAMHASVMELASNAEIEPSDKERSQADFGLLPRTDASAGGVGKPFKSESKNRDSALREAESIIERLELSYSRNAAVLRTLDRMASRL